MTKAGVNKYIPDTPEEISMIGSLVNHLGSLLAAVSALNESVTWTLICIGIVWLGQSVEKYFQMYIKRNGKPNGSEH